MPTVRPQLSAVIELRIERLALLFDSLDPFPMPSRDLSKRAEAFILEWARELSPEARIRIVIHAPEKEALSQDGRLLEDAVKAHFANNAAAFSNELKNLFRDGRVSLMIGLLVLALCFVVAGWLRNSLESTPTTELVSEGLLILGWVANWRPLEIFLYDWWPLARRRRQHQRLALAPVEVRPIV